MPREVINPPGGTSMSLAEIGAEIGVSREMVRIIIRQAQHKVAEQLLQRLGPGVAGLARDEPLRHDDPHRLR